MSTEAMREAFEKFAVARNLDLTEGRFGGYFLADTAAAWASWQAATANQEALIKAAIEEALEMCAECAYDLAVDSEFEMEAVIRQITPQQVMERMK